MRTGERLENMKPCAGRARVGETPRGQLTLVPVLSLLVVRVRGLLGRFDGVQGREGRAWEGVERTNSWADGGREHARHEMNSARRHASHS
eukprot:7577066-Pyramimonas_sp.AAC.1